MPVRKAAEIAMALVKYEVFATSYAFIVRICCANAANAANAANT